MTLELDCPERASDDWHNALAFRASGALPLFLENISLAKNYYYLLLLLSEFQMMCALWHALGNALQRLSAFTQWQFFQQTTNLELVQTRGI